MNNNKKRKTFARFAALLGVVAMLAALLLVPAGAWELTDIPFYNYWDVSKLTPSKNDGSNAYIESVDADTGVMRISAYYSRWGIYYVPWQYTRIYLKDICPEMKEGEAYVLTLESTHSIQDAGNLKSLDQITLCNDDWETNVNWVNGQSLTITYEHLNAYVMFYYGKWEQATYSPGYMDKMFTDVRIWVNKDVAQEYAPYDLMGYYQQDALMDAYKNGYDTGFLRGEETGYGSGYLEGYDKGYADFVAEKLIVSKENVSFVPYFASYDKGTVEAFGTYGQPAVSSSFIPFDYPWNGYTFRTSAIDWESVIQPSGYDKLAKMEISVIPVTYGQYYAVGDSKVSFTGEDCRVTITVGYNKELTRSHTYDINELQTVVIDWESDFGLSAMDELFGISIFVEMHLPLLPEAEWKDFSFAFTDMTGEGYEIGRQDGYDAGVSEGEAAGYEDGYADGIELGYKEGEDTGYASGFEKGKEIGYYQGRADEQEESTFFSLVFSVVDAPISAVRNLFNFNILGVNITGFVLSLFTVAMAIAILKKVL